MTNQTKFAESFRESSESLLTALAATGTDRRESWVKAQDNAYRAILAAHTGDEIRVANSLLQTVRSMKETF